MPQRSHLSLRICAAAAAAATLLGLAGCSNPPTIFRSDPVIITPEKTLDPIHNRDASVEFYRENRGGAAIRAENASHVLYNEHYVAQSATPLPDAHNAKQGPLVSLEDALAKAEKDLEASEAAKNGQNGSSKTSVTSFGVKAAEKEVDQRVFATKDRSVYSKLPGKVDGVKASKSTRDKSIYAGKAAQKVPK
ncbi:hypothetical protein [Sutterella sp.]|uniref:hypothetical protein n=1 Tax=Sutterella sp. TaxID=1981025 RepID=UPI003FD84B11